MTTDIKMPSDHMKETRHYFLLIYIILISLIILLTIQTNENLINYTD